MSLLSTVQAACRLLSIPVPSVVSTSTDTQIQLLFELANEEGQEQARRYDWSLLTREWTFTSSAQTAQVGALPPDFDHFLHDTMFDRTTRRQVIFPITPQVWQAIQSQPQLNRVFLAGRLRGNGTTTPPSIAFIITPTPSSGDTVAYEYVTDNWATDAGGSPQTAYMTDTDVALLDESLIKLGLRWRFRKSKGLDYAEDFRTYETQVTIKEARDGGSTQLNTTGQTVYNNFWPNLPLGNFPGP
jgi:hypothetical protein